MERKWAWSIKKVFFRAFFGAFLAKGELATGFDVILWGIRDNCNGKNN